MIIKIIKHWHEREWSQVKFAAFGINLTLPT